MGKERLFVRGGVRSFTKKYDDGTEEKFFYKSRTPAEISGWRGSMNAFSNDEKGFIERDRFMGKFIASAMCTESGEPLLTTEDVARIPDTLKLEIGLLIVHGSNETGDEGKD